MCVCVCVCVLLAKWACDCFLRWTKSLNSYYFYCYYCVFLR